MRTLRTLFILSIVSLLLISLALPSFAGEAPKRSFSGYVKEPGGSPAVKATVYIYESLLGTATDQVQVNETGYFQISLEAGTYYYSVEKINVGETPGRTLIDLTGSDLFIRTITLQPYPSPTPTPSPVVSPSPVTSPQASPIVTAEPSPGVSLTPSPVASTQPTASTEPSIAPSGSIVPTPDATPGATQTPTPKPTSSVSMLAVLAVIGIAGVLAVRKR